MNGSAHYDPARDAYLIYLSVGPSGEYPLHVDGSQLAMGEPLARFEERRPTLILGTEEYAELRRLLIGEALDSDDALRDTRAVRDRMISMVEKLVDDHVGG